MFYFLIYLIILLFGILHYKKPNTRVNVHIIICFIIFVLVAGLRYEIGVDYFAYRRHFIESENIFKLLSAESDFLKTMFSGWEPGSIIFLAVLKTISNEPQILFFATSLICSIFLFKSFVYFCDKQYLFLTFLIYFCFVYMYQEMHALRQALGASIFYYGLISLSQGNRKRAIFITLIASCFHYSMLLFVPVIFVLDRTLKRKYQLVFIVFSFIIFLFRIPWMLGIINYMSSLFPELGIVIKVVGYTENYDMVRPFFITFILYLLPYILFLYSNKKSYVEGRKLLIAHNLYFLYLIFTMIFWEFSFFSIRYGWVCLFGMAIILPHIITLFKQRWIPILYIVLFCFVPIRTFMFPDLTTGQFTPYENYVSREILGKDGTGRERAIKYLNENGKTLID